MTMTKKQNDLIHNENHDKTIKKTIHEKAMCKQELRSHFLQVRKSIPEMERAILDQMICSQLLQHPAIQKADSLLIYISYASETDTKALIRALLAAGKRVYIPKVLTRETMGFYRIDNFDHLKKSTIGILEPDETCSEVFQVNIFQIKAFPDLILPVMILPGLSFDLTGCRLGYGGGYYDRYLHHCRQLPGMEALSMHLIGICYSCQLSDHLPESVFDYPVDEICTEKGILQILEHNESKKENEHGTS
jgi:5-formyltetrahydrofolate cyclo-ligase